MNFVIKHATLAALILSTTAALSGCVETYSTSSGYYSSQTPPRYYRSYYNNPTPSRPAVVSVATPVVVPVAAPIPATPSTAAVVPASAPSGYSSSEQQQQQLPQPLGSTNAGYASSTNNNPAYTSGYSSR